MTDIGYAFRRIRRAPGFSLIVILTLGLGVGATTSIFSVVNAVVLRPIPIPDVDRVVRVFETNPTTDDFTTSQARLPLTFATKRGSFSTMAALNMFTADMLIHGEPQQLNIANATGSFFTLFGGRPIIGSAFGPEQDAPGGDRLVAVLSEGTWKRMFGADSGVVGRSVNINGTSLRVLGVMPAGYGYLPADMWVPLTPDRSAPRGIHYLTGIRTTQTGRNDQASSGRHRWRCVAVQ